MRTLILALPLALAAIGPAVAGDLITPKRVAALAVTKTADPKIIPRFSLAVMAEDAFFAGEAPTRENIISLIASDLPEPYCIRASRHLNNIGGLTVCIPVKGAGV